MNLKTHAEIMINFKNESTGILEVNWLTPYKGDKLKLLELTESFQ